MFFFWVPGTLQGTAGRVRIERKYFEKPVLLRAIHIYINKKLQGVKIGPRQIVRHNKVVIYEYLRVGIYKLMDCCLLRSPEYQLLKKLGNDVALISRTAPGYFLDLDCGYATKPNR